MYRTLLFFFAFQLLLILQAFAIVNYDEGRLQINGIQLLQDRDNPLAYYYLPQYPRVSTNKAGELELLCIKYVGEGGSESNGGIFHALIEFSLPAEVLVELETLLDEKVPGAKIAGPVPMMQTMKDGEDGLAGFQVISSILNNTDGDQALTQSVISSGHAPLLPGSKAAISAILNQEGATLLWESMQGSISDVSVAINGHYEAAVKGYNAVVSAEVNTIYEHYSRILNQQKDYDKTQIRKISDQLTQDQVLKIEVFDRSSGLGIDTKDMENLMTLVTDKLIELMFDAEVGWAKKPETEVAIDQDQLKGRQERGWFSEVFGGAQDEKYVTDNQFVLKRREDIKVNKFYLNLSKATTIKVPVYSTGNISGIYDAFKEDERYFKTVNLDDPDFQKRDVHFQVDGTFAESFSDVLNFVTVSFRKKYGGQTDDVTRDLVFKRSDLESGTDIQLIKYPRLGTVTDDWLDYEYRTSWSLKGNDVTIKKPVSSDQWVHAKEPAVSLTPPFLKRVVEIDADRSFFLENEIVSASITFYAILAGQAVAQKTVTLRAIDTENTAKVALYHDQSEPVLYQISWYSRQGETIDKHKELKDDYLFLVPPQKTTSK